MGLFAYNRRRMEAAAKLKKQVENQNAEPIAGQEVENQNAEPIAGQEVNESHSTVQGRSRRRQEG